MYGNRLYLAARPPAGLRPRPRGSDTKTVVIVAKILVASLTLASVFALAGSPPAQGQRISTQETLINAVHLKPLIHHRVHARATRTRTRTPARATHVRVTQVHYSYGETYYGRASWYTGSVGACGRALTGYYAASRTLPCGSKVQVSYGGRSIIVTILDRGPNSPDLALDISRSAFAALAPLSKGVLAISWRLARS